MVVQMEEANDYGEEKNVLLKNDLFLLFLSLYFFLFFFYCGKVFN